IVPGFFKDAQDFLFVQFPDADIGRAWLSAVLGRVAASSADAIIPINAQHLTDKAARLAAGSTDESNPAPATNEWFNVGISWQGLERLKTPDRDKLETAFKRSALDRALTLGDRYTNAQTEAWKKWEIGSTDTEPDAVLIVGANTGKRLDELRIELGVDEARGTFAGARLLKAVRGQSRKDAPGREHFGFRDA